MFVFESININELFYAVLGAFWGFFIPFMAQKMIEKKNRKKIINNIFGELLGIKNKLHREIINPLENMDDNLIDQIRKNTYIATMRLSRDQKLRLIDCYDMITGVCLELYVPIWDALVATGDVTEFKDEDYFNDMLQVYTHTKIIFNTVTLQLTSSLSDEIKLDRILKIIKEVTIIESLLSGPNLNLYV